MTLYIRCCELLLQRARERLDRCELLLQRSGICCGTPEAADLVPLAAAGFFEFADLSKRSLQLVADVSDFLRSF